MIKFLDNCGLCQLENLDQADPAQDTSLSPSDKLVPSTSSDRVDMEMNNMTIYNKLWAYHFRKRYSKVDYLTKLELFGR